MKLYHATPTRNMESILKNGLTPSSSKSSLKAVFLAIDENTARNYVYMHNEDCAILEIDISDMINELEPDNYELPDMLESMGDSRSWSDCTGVESLQICAQCAIYRDIPASNIKVIGYKKV